MLQYQEVYATVTFEFIMTLRRLSLARIPKITKDNTDEIFTVWTFAAKWAK